LGFCRSIARADTAWRSIDYKLIHTIKAPDKVTSVMIDPLALVRAIATLGAAVVVGSGVLIWYTRDVLEPAGGSTWRRRVILTVLVSAFIGAIATGLGAVGAAAAADTGFFSVNAATVETFLLKTGVGRIAIVEIGCAVAVCIPAVLAWFTHKTSSISNLALMAAAEIAAVGLATFPFNSHPVRFDQEVAGLLASIAHRLALAVWAGGLPALIMLIGVGPIPDDTRRLAAAVLRRFSRLATLAMGVILVSGVLLTRYLVGNFPGMIGTEYGRLLLLKLAMLGGVLLIASGLQRELGEAGERIDRLGEKTTVALPIANSCCELAVRQSCAAVPRQKGFHGLA